MSQGTDEAQAQVDALELAAPSDANVWEPSTPRGAWQLAESLSQADICPKELRGKPGAVMAVISAGKQLGLDWGQSIQKAYVVYGRVSWPAEVLAGLLDSAPDWDFFEVLSLDNKQCTIEGKKSRWADPRTYQVTIEEAKIAGYLDGKHSAIWMSGRPKIMLKHMAFREAARMWDPARCAGIDINIETDRSTSGASATPVKSALLDGNLAPSPEVTEPAATAQSNKPLPESHRKDLEKALRKAGALDVAAEELGPPSDWTSEDVDALNGLIAESKKGQS